MQLAFFNEASCSCPMSEAAPLEPLRGVLMARHPLPARAGAGQDRTPRPRRGSTAHGAAWRLRRSRRVLGTAACKSKRRPGPHTTHGQAGPGLAKTWQHSPRRCMAAPTEPPRCRQAGTPTRQSEVGPARAAQSNFHGRVLMSDDAPWSTGLSTGARAVHPCRP